MIWQFAYIYKVTKISLFSRKKKIQNMTVQFSFSILCTRFTMSYQTSQKIFPRAIYQPKFLLYELSLRKSLIKNHNNIISGRIIIWIKHNQILQSPTWSSKYTIFYNVLLAIIMIYFVWPTAII